MLKAGPPPPLEAILVIFFRDVYVTKKAIAKIEAEVPISVRPQIQPIVVMARKNAKSARKRTLIAKFERLEKRKESQQPWGGRTNVFKVTQPSAERVSVLDDIEVSPTAIGILPKGPKYVVSPSWSRQELQHTVQVEIAALAYSLRWQSAMEAQPGLNLAASGTNTNNTTLHVQDLPIYHWQKRTTTEKLRNGESNSRTPNGYAKPGGPMQAIFHTEHHNSRKEGHCRSACGPGTTRSSREVTKVESLLS